MSNTQIKGTLSGLYDSWMQEAAIKERQHKIAEERAKVLAEFEASKAISQNNFVHATIWQSWYYCSSWFK